MAIRALQNFVGLRSIIEIWTWGYPKGAIDVFGSFVLCYEWNPQTQNATKEDVEIKSMELDQAKIWDLRMKLVVTFSLIEKLKDEKNYCRKIES